MNKCCAFLITAVFTLSILDAGTLKNGTAFFNVSCLNPTQQKNEEIQLSIDEQYSCGLECLQKGDFETSIQHFVSVITQFPESSNRAESYYHLGIAYFKIEEFDFANTSFTQYLKSTNQPNYFEETLGYKYEIAEKFRLGAKRHIFGVRKLPKWASANALALQIYDEIIYSLPCHDYAAHSLFSKASILWSECQWREAIDAFQALIRRFPKHELCPQAYLCINKVYLEQSKKEFQNPDLIALAQINLRKFAKEFPKDESLALAEKDVQAIKEVYASGFYDTAKYYEDKGKLDASIIYYQCAINQFPDTQVAELCKKRLVQLGVS